MDLEEKAGELCTLLNDCSSLDTKLTSLEHLWTTLPNLGYTFVSAVNYTVG